MIHYHGSPITPATAASKVLAGRHSFVSFANPEQLPIAIEVCQSFALDNGAFSAWMSGEPIADWFPFYKWVASNMNRPGFDFFVIPDVIDGDEKANDKLLKECPLPNHMAAPVWHMHESLSRLQWLARSYPRVCIGSSGEFATVGNGRWWLRINEAMNSIIDEHGHPITKLHGLRMLDPDVFTRLPFSSADSTSVGRGIGIDSKWNGSYQPPDKDWRALVLAARIESHNSATHWVKQPEQDSICLF
jgi:hypothetical protein